MRILLSGIIGAIFLLSCKPTPGVCPVRICGSTTLYPIMTAALASLSRANREAIELSATGSVGGYWSLLDGACDICDSSYRLAPQEIDALAKKGIRVREIAIGYDLVIPIVHPSNPLGEIAPDALRGIFAGTVASWKELRGPDLSIKPVCRDEGSGTGAVWSKRFMRDGPCASGSLRARSNSESLSTVAHEPGAIGYISRAFLNPEVKELKIAGHPTDPAAMKRHPGFRTLYLYVNEKNECPAGRALLVYLMSAGGKELLRNHRFTPATDGGMR